MAELTFYVNGNKVTETNPDPKTLLAEYLRYKLKLTGTKISCGEGGCGSCTVMVSRFDRSTSKIFHYAVNACILPICLLHGLAVTTVEALGSTKTKLHQIQEKLVASHGIQCGFCTPGMVMSLYALLRSNTGPTELQIEHALKGNLCRCTGYRPILDAFRSFSKTSQCPMGDQCCQNQSKVEESVVDVNAAASATDQFYPDKQELIFPPELQLSKCYDEKSLKFASDSVTWFRPTTLNELLNLKKQHPDALIIAGGTNVVFRLKNIAPSQHLVIVAATHISELQTLEEKDDGLWIGAMTSVTLLESKLSAIAAKLPELKTRLICSLLDTLHVFGSPQIRNRATIGGSLATASANADVNVLLLTTGCRVKIVSADGEKVVNIQEDFFRGNSKTCLRSDELIIGLFLPYSTKDDYYDSYKQSPRKDLTLADINTGLHVEFEDGSDVVKNAHLVFGGLSSAIFLAKQTSRFLIGRKWDGNLLEELMTSLAKDSEQWKGDLFKYKLAVAQGFLFKFFLKVYNQRFQKMNLLDLTEEEEIYLKSPRAALDHVHSGIQVYDLVSGQSEVDAVGQPLPHRWAKQSATGEAIYIDDMLPSQGELYLTLVTSTKANAKILSVDPSAALAMPGVVCYIDSTSTVKPHISSLLGGTEELFASKEVHWVGQLIGAIVAESHDQARRAARAVAIQYDELEPIISIEDAISKKSFHPWHHGTGVINYGDVKAAFASCDHVIEGEVTVGGQEHFYMETQTVRVVPKGEDGEMDVFASAQYATGLQVAISEVLDIPCNKITIHTKRIGGSFGGKEFRAFLSAVPTATAAHKLNRPVRCALERRQDMQMTGNRRPYVSKYKVGFNKDGKVLALDLEMYSNDGFLPEFGHLLMAQSLFYCDNCYSIPNISVRGYVCKTNLPPCTAMRGAGVPQGIFICEHWMTKVAEFLGQPPHKVRERNLYRGGDVTFISVPIEDSMQRCFNEVLKQSDYERVSGEIEKFNSQSTVLKRGIAVVPLKFSPNLPPAWTKHGALVNVYLDGSVLLHHGGVETGQGLHTKMIQIASRALGLSVDRIHISETCTNVIPNAVTTGGSSGTDLNGQAILNACNTLMERLKPFKDADPTGKWENWIKAAYQKSVQLSASGFHNKAFCGGEYDWNTGKGQPYGYYTYGSAVCQVEIDCLTGSYSILKVDIVMDVGKSINPAIDVGQIEGAFVMGTGYYALEDHQFGPDGHLKTIGAGKYHVPTISSIPREMNVSLLKTAGHPLTVYSSKGIGEPPLLLSISVFFAIRNAVCAARGQAGLPPNFDFNSPATLQTIRLACGTDPQKLIKPSK